ncbi:MAG: c-type cytochrome [Aestuariivirga sp.]
MSFLAMVSCAQMTAGGAPRGDPERGKAIVVGAPGLAPEQACISCHGIDGQGDPAAAFPRLAAQSQDYLLRALEDYADGRRVHDIMTPVAKALSSGQRQDVTAFYASRRDTAWIRPPLEKPELLQYGAALAAIGSATLGIQGCINCHGPAGKGLPPTAPYLSGQPASYIAARLVAWRGANKADDATPANIMARLAGRMGEREIAAVSEYYAQIAPDPIPASTISAAGQPLNQEPTP